jgi:hypothetical protein
MSDLEQSPVLSRVTSFLQNGNYPAIFDSKNFSWKLTGGIILV